MTPIRERDYRVETSYACAWVRVRGGVIVDAESTIWRRWYGRPFADLEREAAEVKDITDQEHE